MSKVKLTTLEKKLRLPWCANGSGAFTSHGAYFSAAVSPLLYAGTGGVGHCWMTQVTLTSLTGSELVAEYSGCLTEHGQRLVECYLFDRSIGIPHAAKELRRLSRSRTIRTK